MDSTGTSALHTLVRRGTGEPVDVGAALASGAFPADAEVRLDLARVARVASPGSIAEGPPALWRYAPLLPVDRPGEAVTLGEGWTPLLDASRLGRELGCESLLVKDEGRNPSGSFKDRGASVAVTRLREFGVRRVALSSSGNAGAAWSLYCARAGIECLSVLPSDALAATRAQCSLSGADARTLPGDWRDAGAAVERAARERGALNVNTLREPFRVEGKKTLGYEIAEQLGWTLPDVLVYPTGGGLGPIALYKAFAELVELGWVSGPLPRLVVAQYEGCAPIVRAHRRGDTEITPWGEIRIPPGGLKAPSPPGGRRVLEILRETGGTAHAVSTRDALDAVGWVTRCEGIFPCPETATTIPALAAALEEGTVRADERIVIAGTGTGLKSIANFCEPLLPPLPGPD